MKEHAGLVRSRFVVYNMRWQMYVTSRHTYVDKQTAHVLALLQPVALVPNQESQRLRVPSCVNLHEIA